VIENISNIFLGILGMNMAIIGIVVIIVPIVMLVKKKQEVTNIRSIIFIVVGPLLTYVGIYLARKYIWH
jgi:Co/Zn/Cd efflux system component